MTFSTIIFKNNKQYFNWTSLDIYRPQRKLSAYIAINQANTLQTRIQSEQADRQTTTFGEFIGATQVMWLCGSVLWENVTDLEMLKQNAIDVVRWCDPVLYACGCLPIPIIVLSGTLVVHEGIHYLTISQNDRIVWRQDLWSIWTDMKSFLARTICLKITLTSLGRLWNEIENLTQPSALLTNLSDNVSHI